MKKTSNVFLFEDHNESLRIWTKKRVKMADLVHVDAHIDIKPNFERSIDSIIAHAGSLKELKKGLVQGLACLRYRKTPGVQPDMTNYIYTAMQKKIVKNMYWVIPGGISEFKKTEKAVKRILSRIKQDDRPLTLQLKKGLIKTRLFGRNIIVCTIKTLPVLKKKVILDIDTDFLVTDHILESDNTAKISRRKSWISPEKLAGTLKEKIINPRVITIAYSVNGGYTPISEKILGDKLAYCFYPRKFNNRLKINSRAAGYFSIFTITGKKKYYWKAVSLNPSYRVNNNNYGPLYLLLKKPGPAQKEFLKIMQADPKNISCLTGLGHCAFMKAKYKEAKKYFSSALKLKPGKLFIKYRDQALLGLAKTEFMIGNLGKAKILLSRYKKRL